MPEADLHAERTDRFDLRALYETSRILSASLDLEFVLNSLLLTGMSKLLVMRGAAFLYDPIKRLYRTAAAKGIRDLAVGSEHELTGVVVGEMMRGEAIPSALRELGMAVVLSVAYGDREIGLVALGEKATRQPFENRELEFIHSLVNMSASAVHNSLMVEELKQANRDLDNKVQQLNTLFDLSQEFNATVDRDRLVKLLTFALMGQMLVNKHVFLLGDEGGGDGEVNGKTFRVVTAKGIGRDPLDKGMLRQLCSLKELYLVDRDVPEEWKTFADRGLQIALPIRQKGETCGVLCLGPKMTGQPYQPDEVEFLYALGNLAFVSLQNAYLVEQQLEKERLEEEMRLAREIQERLQPQSIPKMEGLDIAALAIASRHVAGDYYDLVPLEGERLLVAIADVTGKGMPASLLMSNLQAALHSLTPIDLSLEDATSNINRVICQNTGFDKFITYFHGIYSKADRSFRYVNAGHNPPMLIRPDGSMELLEKGGLLLGVMKGMPYESGLTTIGPGDVLALFTDGVTEAMSPDEEEYGEERLERLLRENTGADAAHILNAVREDVRVFTDDAPVLSDDLTMIVVKGV
jgi:sigma-B regulation protein RsbU (phosphoserine phosphatase)